VNDRLCSTDGSSVNFLSIFTYAQIIIHSSPLSK
jgi:hypothetical protein